MTFQKGFTLPKEVLLRAEATRKFNRQHPELVLPQKEIIAKTGLTTLPEKDTDYSKDRWIHTYKFPFKGKEKEWEKFDRKWPLTKGTAVAAPQNPLPDAHADLE